MQIGMSDVSLVVRHTFWELHAEEEAEDAVCLGNRRRAQSMSAIEMGLEDLPTEAFEPLSACEKSTFSSGSTTPSGSFPGTFDFSMPDSASDTLPGTPHESDDDQVNQSWVDGSVSPPAYAAWCPPMFPNNLMPVMVPVMLPMGPTTSLEGTAQALTAAAERLRIEARSARVAAASARIDSLDIPLEQRTTLMLRDLPKSMSRNMLTDVLNAHGFHKLYDFVYLPLDFKKGKNLGYAFVNFVSHADAMMAMNRFQGFNGWPVSAEAACVVVWSAPHQGLEAHVERYRESPVMHPDVPEEFRPLLLRNGGQIPFPAPTKELSPPSISPKSSKQPIGRGRRSRA